MNILNGHNAGIDTGTIAGAPRKPEPRKMVPSPALVASDRPSGVNASASAPPSWPPSVASKVAVSRSQKRTVS